MHQRRRVPCRTPLRVALLLTSALLAACGDGVEAAHGAGTADDVPATTLRFVDVAADAGVRFAPTCGDPRRWTIPESNGTGAAWLDHDGDGDLDLFVGNGPHVEYVDDLARMALSYPDGTHLFANETEPGGAWRFRDATEEAGARVDAWVNGVTVGDPDGDGDPDVYLTCLGPDVYLRNAGGTFEPVPPERSGLSNPLWGTGATFGDPDRDGDLDLYVANYCVFDPEAPPDGGKRMLVDGVEVAWGPEAENPYGYNAGAPDVYFRNGGDGRFAERTEVAGLALQKPLCSYAALFRDVDADGWPDLLVANDGQPANLFHNRGNGTFSEEGARRGFATNADGKPTAAMGLLVADVDRDGDLDVLRTNFDLQANSLHVNDGVGTFREEAARRGLATPSFARLGWGGGFLDADLDGDLDLVVANGHVMPQSEEIGMSAYLEPSQLYECERSDDGSVAWRDVTGGAGPGLLPARNSRGVAIGDPDGDGDLDMVVVDIDAPVRLLRNESARRGHWLGLRLHGAGGNTDAVGARVRVSVGAETWTAEAHRDGGLFSSHDPRLLFGLGAVTGSARVEVTWPDGTVTTREGLALDRYHPLDQEH